VSAVSYVAGLWEWCVAALQSAKDSSGGTATAAQSGKRFRTQGHDGGDDSDGPALLVYGQALWMAVTLALLFALTLLSARLYFLVSFIGLLINRLLFAPRERAGRWWRITNAITWLCFAVLAYVIYLRVQVAMAMAASA
jgi:hypothetical protein